MGLKGPQNGLFWTPFGTLLSVRVAKSGYLRSGDLFWTPFGPHLARLGPFGRYGQARTPFGPLLEVQGRLAMRGPFGALLAPLNHTETSH